MIWYLGPLGDLRPLVCPETDLTATQVRYGGVHQGLSGARTLDITGYRSEYTLELKWLDESEFRYLEAMHTRMLPGPYRLLDPVRRNRLSVQSTSLLVDASQRSGLRLPPNAQYAVTRDFPTAITLPGRSLKVYNWTAATAAVWFDQYKQTAVMSGESVYASLYVKSEASHSGAYLQIEWYDPDGVPISVTNSSTFTISTSWTRRSISGATPPAGASGGTMSLRFNSANTPIYIAAPQFEVGSLSDWQVGGAAPEVIIETLPTVYPRFPLRNVTLTLLEA